MTEEIGLTLECRYFESNCLQNLLTKLGTLSLAIPSLITFLSNEKPDVNTRIIVEYFPRIFPICVD
jgi:hypothetical protein